MKAKDLIAMLQNLEPQTQVYIGERGRTALYDISDAYKVLLPGGLNEFILEWSDVPVSQ